MSLNQLDIVITRPKAQAEAWAKELIAQGAVVHQLPLLEIKPLTQSEQQQAIKNKILELDHYQKIIFVSQNAVAYGMEWIENYWPQLPVRQTYFAVGAATAKQLEAFGVAVVNMAQDPTGSMTSEALLSLPELQAVSGEKILILRGLGGRGLMAEVLRERGASVDYCEVYERHLPAMAAQEIDKLFLTMPSARLRVFCVHSGETLENFVKILKSSPKSFAESAYNVVLLVPSERVAALAREQGFTQVVAADNATDPAMLKALQMIDAQFTY